MKKYRTAKKEGILELIATQQKMSHIYDQKEKQQKLSKEELQGSKMRLLNVVFSDDFFDSIVTTNDRKLRAELDAGGAGANKRRWAELTESYNESVNNDAYGSYALVAWLALEDADLIDADSLELHSFSCLLDLFL